MKHTSELVFFLLFVLSCSGGPAMPVGFVRINQGTESKTWRETGEVNMPYVMGLSAVKAALLAQGYSEKHTIELGEKSNRCVMLWEGEKEKVIVMAWEAGSLKTGCSWGISNE